MRLLYLKGFQKYEFFSKYRNRVGRDQYFRDCQIKYLFTYPRSEQSSLIISNRLISIMSDKCFSIKMQDICLWYSEKIYNQLWRSSPILWNDENTFLSLRSFYFNYTNQEATKERYGSVQWLRYPTFEFSIFGQVISSVFGRDSKTRYILIE